MLNLYCNNKNNKAGNPCKQRARQIAMEKRGLSRLHNTATLFYEI